MSRSCIGLLITKILFLPKCVSSFQLTGSLDIHVSVNLVIMFHMMETLFEYQQFDVLIVCSLAKLIHNKL